MRLRQAVAGLRNAEIAIMRIGAQAIGFEILVAIVTDGDALFRPRARFCGRQPSRLGLAILLAILGLDMFSRGGSGSGFARRRFFLRGGAGRGLRCRLFRRLFPGHRRSPFPSRSERLAQFVLRRVGLSDSEPAAYPRGGHGARAPSHPTEFDQCSRNTPSTARSSAGLISLECATVTANSGPSSFSSQKERKSFSAGKFGNRS